MFLDDLVLAREDRGPVDLHVFHFETKLFGALEVIVDIGVVQETFVGMQPTCRHVPPRNGSFSMTAVFSPHCEARIAATYPPGRSR